MTFEEVCSKNQRVKVQNKPGSIESNIKAFKFSFSLNIDHEREEGYRDLDVLIYGAFSYVQVYYRERANVILLDDLQRDAADDQLTPKVGKSYSTVIESWKKIADHDSCWREGVQNIIKLFGERMQTLNAPQVPYSSNGWWALVSPFDEGING